MFTRRIAALLAAGALVTGAGAAVALADDSPTANPSNVPSVTCPTTIAAPALQEQVDQLGVDEQATTNDVAAAADDVQVEADNEGADDQSGDQQGPDDQSEEPDDTCQSDN